MEVPLQKPKTLLSQIPSLNRSRSMDPEYRHRGYQQGLTFGKILPSHISSFCGEKNNAITTLCLILDDSHSHPVCLLKSECIWRGKHQSQSDSNLKGNFLPGEGKRQAGEGIKPDIISHEQSKPAYREGGWAGGNPAAGTALSWYGI